MSRFFFILLVLFVVARVRASRSRGARGRVQKALSTRSEQLLVTGYSNHEDAIAALVDVGLSANEAQKRLASLPAVIVEHFNPQSNFGLLVALDAAGVECMVTDRPSTATRAIKSPTQEFAPRPVVTTQPTDSEPARTPPKAEPVDDAWQAAHEIETPPQPPTTPSPQLPAHPEPSQDLSTTTSASEQPQRSAEPVWATQDLDTLPDDITQALQGSDHRVIERSLRRSSLNGMKEADTALGIALISWGRLDDAETAFRARLYDDPVAANNLGCLAYQSDNYADAKRHFQRAIDLGSAEAEFNLALEVK